METDRLRQQKSDQWGSTYPLKVMTECRIIPFLDLRWLRIVFDFTGV